jgi:hypothetical protein
MQIKIRPMTSPRLRSVIGAILGGFWLASCYKIWRYLFRSWLSTTRKSPV